MTKMGQGQRCGVVVAAGVLLLGFIGCTTTLERAATVAPEPAQANSESAGFLSEFPTQPPASASALPVAAGDAPTEVTAEAEAPIASDLKVDEIMLGEREGQQALLVQLSRPPDGVRHFTLHTPERLVIDVSGPMPAVTRAETHSVHSGSITRVRTGAYEGRLRIVADLDQGTSAYTVDARERSLIAVFGDQPAPAFAQVVYHAPDAAPAPKLAAVEEPVPTEHAGAEALALGPEADAAPGDGSGSAAGAIEPVAEAATAMQPGSTDNAPAAPAPPAEPEVALAPVDGGGPAPFAAEPEAPTQVALADTASAVAAEPATETPHEAAAPPETPTEPTVLPVQAGGKAKPKAKGGAKRGGSVVTPIDGGTIVQLGPRTPKEYTGQRISLDFKDADIQNVLRILADVSGLNIITTEEVQGKLTMRLVDVPWDQAFDAILQAKNLDSVRDGNIIRVSTVEQLKKERDAQRAADEAQKQVEPLEVHYVKVNYAKADDKLVKKVQEVLTDRGSATWDERTNTIVVRDIARGVADAEELIAKFDTQTPQVLIEAALVEATDDLVRDLGIQWGYTYRASPETGNSTGYNFPGRVQSGGTLAGGKNSPAGPVPFIADFPAANVTQGAGSAYDLLLGSLDGAHSLNARLTALESQGKGKIISRPRVVTLNNVPAKIESLRILRVKLPSTGTVISTGAGGVAGSSQNATEQIRTGITLQVTPQVSSDGFIFLDVFAKSSTTVDSTSPDNIPDEISREAESHVLIKDGETFVLGGVFRNVREDTDRGIPYLRSIPVLGWAFKNNLKRDKHEELLVFVTPSAVEGRGTEDLASLPSAENLWQNRSNP